MIASVAQIQIDPEALARADDVQFASIWFAMKDEQKAALPDDVRRVCVSRYVKLDPFGAGESIRRLNNFENRKARAGAQDNDAERSTPALPPLDWNELSKLEPPRREWAEDEWLGAGYNTAFIGPGGVGKSTAGQQWLSTQALGRGFITTASGRRKGLMWACEDDPDECWRRQSKIASWQNVPLEEFAGGLFVQPRVGLENTLFTTEFGRPMFTPVLEQLRQQVHDLGAENVILDNVAQVFGGNENDRHHVTAFLNAITGTLPGRAVILMAHPSRTAGSEYSGSSAWENACRMRLYFGSRLPDQPPDDESTDTVRYLAKRKANYTVADYRRFTFRDGVFVPDAVEIGGGLMDGLRQQKAERVVIDTTRRLRDMGVRMTDGSTSPQFLPKLILEYKLAEGCTKRELADAMRQAMLDGRMKRGIVGKYENRVPMHGLIVED